MKTSSDSPRLQAAARLLLVLLLVLAVSGCSNQARTARYLARGKLAFDAQQYDRAEIEYLNALRLSPQNALVLRQLGAIYLDQGRTAQAYACLKRSLALEPGNAESRVRLCWAYLSVRQFREAAADALEILRTDPGHEEAIQILANSAGDVKALDEARARIERLVAQHPDRATYHLALGTVLFRGGDLAKAECEFIRAAEMDPKSSAVFAALGNLYWKQNETAKAAEYLDRAAELSPLRSPRRLRYAEFLLRTGNAAAAQAALQNLRAKAPDYLPATVFLAQLAFAQTNLDECLTLTEQVLVKAPENFEALLLRGNVNLARGDLLNAITNFSRLCAVYERAPQPHFYLGRALILAGDVERGAASLKEATRLDPDFPEAVLLLAEIDVRRGNTGPAISSLTRLIKQQPQNSQAGLLLAGAHLAENDPESALEVYRKMEVNFPRDHRIPFLTAVTLAARGDRAVARAACQRALMIAPDFWPALELMVDIDVANKDYQEVSARVRAQIERNPAAAEPKMLLAKMLVAQKDIPEAEALLQEAIRVNPELPTPYLMLAEVYMAGNRHEQALEKLTASVEHTKDISAMMQLGTINERLKRFGPAREWYEKILSVNPRFYPALNNLAYLYLERWGRLDDACRTAEQALRVRPEDPACADTLGWALFKKGELPRAVSLLEESAQKLPRNPEAQFHVGMARYRLGEEASARAAFQRATQAASDAPWQEEAARRLGFLALDSKAPDPALRARLEEHLRREPSDPVVLLRFGSILERDGALDQALRAYEEVVKCNPRNALLVLRLAQFHADRLHDYGRAMEWAKKAHQLDPNNAVASQLLGRCAFKVGDFNWALSLLEEAARGLPDDASVLYDLAWSRYSLGRLPEAEAAMERLSQMDVPATPDARQFLKLVTASRDSARALQSEEEARRLLARESNSVPALMVCATAEQAKGNRSSAIQLLERILARYPSFVPAMTNLAQLHSQDQHALRRAFELASKAREALPEDPRVARLLGILACRKGDYPRAALLLAEAARRLPADAELAFYTGVAQHGLKHFTEAKAALQSALDLKLSAELVPEARRLLSTIR
jgi:tetratricopeptide (TPR) repeat protein